jgi:hypothetical protein
MAMRGENSFLGTGCVLQEIFEKRTIPNISHIRQ